MLIISVRDNENNGWNRNAGKNNDKKGKKKKKKQGEKSYSERVRAKWFRCAFKLGFPQLNCKASLSFKLNLVLESVLSII